MRLTLITLLLAGCTPAAIPIEKATFAPSLEVDLSASRKVQGMYLRDLEEGTGATVGTGNQVTMRYTGWLTDGTQFDSNQDAGFKFRIGVGEVIDGWDVGVPGMKLGGSRQLIIPPDMGYGEQGVGPIPGNAILVFNVTLLSSP